MNLTEKLQIDAILTDSAGKLVHIFCGDAWNLLPQLWTITPGQVFAEAERRGWECLVEARSLGETFVVFEQEGTYVSGYFERGNINARSARVFPTIELAARDMLSRRMQEVGLLPRESAA